MTAEAPESSAEPQAATLLVTEFKQMIVTGELLPGQQIRQEAMAAKFGVSRLPVREALRQLTTEGLVRHVPNVGYSVARLSHREYDQIYLMRRLLETEVIMALPRATASQLNRLTQINDQIISAAECVDLVAMNVLNQAFHFGIFNLGDMNLVVAEIERLWTAAIPYHSIRLYSRDGREGIIKEHKDLLVALGLGDNSRVVAIMDEHRKGSEHTLNLTLQSGEIARTSAS
jgi:DNA-binding GntR family transcriptional regulator